LSHAEICTLLADALFGVVSYPVDYVAKSSVFAAYCAHGICPILISPQYSATDGLIPNQHYLAGIPENTCQPTTVADIGLAAWNWYQPHRLASHIEALTKLLAAVDHV
jgi:hypothetical protein